MHSSLAMIFKKTTLDLDSTGALQSESVSARTMLDPMSAKGTGSFRFPYDAAYRRNCFHAFLSLLFEA